jgi:hypothetical protein
MADEPRRYWRESSPGLSTLVEEGQESPLAGDAESDTIQEQTSQPDAQENMKKNKRAAKRC